ncbi:LAFA_0D17414g1_1 [Lachancea sp. 'fantastica']|nr:LAFA_0D17414g1_1 [Lachancea sp. 'fantastica']
MTIDRKTKRTSEQEADNTKRAHLKSPKRKNLIVNAFIMGSAGNQSVGIWRHPQDKSADLYQSPEYWMNLAKLLEKGKFNAVFLADVLGPYDVYQGPGNFGPVAKAGSQWPISDPSYFIPLMAAVTKKLAFGITISTISEQPYHLARRLGTLDLLTNGRVGWNIVTSYLDSASRNLLNGKTLPPNDERYARAGEFVDVIYKLFLSSWRDGSFKADKKSGVFTDSDGLRHINHEGTYFNVPGPAITHPSKQKLPVIIQAGTSAKGKDLSAKNAEVVFLASLTPEALGASIKDIKHIATMKYSRDPSKIKFIGLLTVILGDTHEEAETKYEDYKANYSDEEGAKAMFSGWTGVDIDKFQDDEVLSNVDHIAIASAVKKWQTAYPRVEKWTKKAIIEEIKVGGSGPVLIGTPQEVALEIQNWVDISDIDGFNFAYTVLPQSFEEIVDKLLPELEKLGLFWHDYPESSDSSKYLTFREQLFGDTYLDKTHPASDLRWRADESREAFEARLDNN